MNITVINTGGTFNKIYNPLTGELDVPKDSFALDKLIESLHNVSIEIMTVISKDSLEITLQDREMLVKIIQECENENIIIVHGTDTMELSAEFIAQHIVNKKIILTGAMIPMSINAVEATMNFSLALGFLNASISNGIYIAMHGAVTSFKNIHKDKLQGKFLRID
jgi:L-asparaginase